MKFSIKLYFALEDEDVRNFLNGKYLLTFSKDYKKVFVFDGEEYYEKFMNKLLRGDLSKYKTTYHLGGDVLRTLKPIRDP